MSRDEGAGGSPQGYREQIKNFDREIKKLTDENQKLEQSIFGQERQQKAQQQQLQKDLQQDLQLEFAIMDLDVQIDSMVKAINNPDVPEDQKRQYRQQLEGLRKKKDEYKKGRDGIQTRIKQLKAAIKAAKTQLPKYKNGLAQRKGQLEMYKNRRKGAKQMLMIVSSQAAKRANLKKQMAVQAEQGAVKG